MRYLETKVVFQEVPGEITLAINISGCPIKCPDCHSKHLWKNEGELLNSKVVDNLIESNNGITCICFMGGDADVSYLQSLFEHIRENHPTLKIAWYSGDSLHLDQIKTRCLDYLKVGPYIKEKGPLNSTTTNQRFYRVFNNELINMTGVFWK